MNEANSCKSSGTLAKDVHSCRVNNGSPCMGRSTYILERVLYIYTRSHQVCITIKQAKQLRCLVFLTYRRRALAGGARELPATVYLNRLPAST
jgi:hypothetical protein